jgi:hypothetical protein
MASSDFVFLCLLVALGYFVAADFLRPRRARGPKPREPSRWKRFRVRPDALQSGGGATLLSEEPKGLELKVLSGRLDALPLSLGEGGRKPLLRFERPFLAWKPCLLLRIEGRPWLRLRPSGGSADFEEAGEAAQSPLPLDRVQIQGNLPSREYEIKLDGRLAASVSWQRDDRGSEVQAGTYFLEVARSVPVVATIGLVIAIEAAAQLDGCLPTPPAAVPQTEAAGHQLQATGSGISAPAPSG